MPMKNITVSMEDADAEWVRIEAARRNSSVSRLLGDYVEDLRLRQDAYARSLQDWLGKARTWSSNGAAYPTRAGTEWSR